ncbi:MAG: hypothetical protein AB9903_24920 [Vulcanimicrobiota bacterium]
MDNIQSANIQAQTQRVQEMGAKHAASLYGAAASGKADELQSKSETAEPEERVVLSDKKVDGQEGAETTSQAGAESVETYSESTDGEQSSLSQTAERGVELSDDSLKAAEAMVKQQIKEARPEELSKTQPLAEPKLLDLRLADSVSVADINDTMTGKPLPPVLDDPYCTHTDLSAEEIERITREAEESLKAQQSETVGETAQAQEQKAAEPEGPPQEAAESAAAVPQEAGGPEAQPPEKLDEAEAEYAKEEKPAE